jgi:hypothetical protein
MKMQFKQKLAYIALGVLFVFAWQLPNLIVNNVTADHHEMANDPIKYVFAIDYPLGKKGEYLEWIKSIAPILQAPEEVKRLASYDNFYGSNPHRLVELEFANIEDAMKYLGREEIKKILGDLPSHSSRARVDVFTLRGDYSKAGIGMSAEGNKAIVRRLIEEWNNGNQAAFWDAAASDCVIHGEDGKVTNPQEMKPFLYQFPI